MKVGFAVQSNDGLESTVYGHFGSAPAFIIVDTELKTISAVNNGDAHHVHGACNPVRALGGVNVDAVVVGGIGPGAIMKLNALGIKVYRAGAPKVHANIDLLAENKLSEIRMDDACREHGGTCGN